MKLANPLRFILLFVGCLVAGLALAAQSASIAFIRKAPETAVMLFPLNGLARQNVATAVFTSSVTGSSGPEQAALVAEKWARNAYETEPLTPEAHAILALAQGARAKRSKVIGLASLLNRREPTLQALVLQEYVEAEDYSKSVETLDQILRVRPARSSELFPVLLPVFARDGAVKEFAEVLDGTSPWHQRFVNYAVAEPTALKNLLDLRYLVNFDDLKFDQALLRNLVQQDETSLGYDFYTKLLSNGGRVEAKGGLGWESTYPPFDWRFTDHSDFRAQTSLDGGDLELYVRPGNGGVFAWRIVETPDTPFSVSIEHEISPKNLSKDVKIALRCTQAGEPFLEQEFGEHSLRLFVEKTPSECRFMEIKLQARAWTGQSALRGTISSLVIE